MNRIIKYHSSALITLVLCCLSYCLSAQNVYNATPHDSTQAKKTAPVKKATPKVILPKKPKPISKEMSFGARLNSNGWGIFMDRGKVKSDDTKHSDIFYNIRLWQIDFSEIKDPKEIKSNGSTQSASGASPSAYIFGKENDFYALNIGYGFRKMIAGKPDPGCVSIHWVGIGGVSVGLLKPYYVKAYVNGVEQDIKYSDSLKNTFLDQNSIEGSSGFGKGIGEIKVVPGIHVKTALHFDFAASHKTILAAEAGINAELYSQSVPIMALQKATPYFVNVYLSFQFGKRW